MAKRINPDASPNNALKMTTDIIKCECEDVIPVPPNPNFMTRTFIVGIDGTTIQECIDLAAVGANSNNVGVVVIPPGSYTENLTLKQSVMLQGSGNFKDTTTTKIIGAHTFTPTSLNAVNNRISIQNCLLVALTDTPILTIAGTTQVCQVNTIGCFFQDNSNTNTYGMVQITNANARYYSLGNWYRGSGATGPFAIRQTNASLVYSGTGDDYDVTAILEQATGAGAAVASFGYSTLRGTTSGSLFKVTGILFLSHNNVINAATNGSAVNLTIAGASVSSTHNRYDIAVGTGYVITGVASTIYANAYDTYTNTGLAARNVKLKNTVTAVAFTSSLTPSA
jgi:hypothetical protein